MAFSTPPTEHFDVIVVGGGHAGCEAAITAARLGCSTALFSLNLDRIAWQPCNPAVGGPAKSQLVHEVDALGGAPGVHSARFAHLESGQPGNAPDAANNEKLLRLLASVPATERTARFRCVLALVRLRPAGGEATAVGAPGQPGEVHCFEGSCPGRISERAAGDGGFGYDPLFVPDGYAVSFAELGEAVKNSLSHRARALAALRLFLG